MDIRAIDERDSTSLVDSPTYRVFDWIGDGALAGETTELHAYELTDTSLWEVLEWAQRDRVPAPSLSEIYACAPEEQGVTLVFLGSLTWQRDQSGSSAQRTIARL